MAAIVDFGGGARNENGVFAPPQDQLTAGSEPASSGGLLDKAAYISRDFAALEKQKLWPSSWLIACRQEEVPKSGDYYVFDIAGESIIIVRDRQMQLNAFYNVCQHRGRRLLESGGCGHTAKLFCKYHGWRWKLDGASDVVLDREDWGDSLQDDDIRLKSLKVDVWGGFVFVHMDIDAEPLEKFLEPVIRKFRNYQMENMRFVWKRTTTLACNWKAAVEVFAEGYHAEVQHRQLTLMGGTTRFLTEFLGLHSVYKIRVPPDLSVPSDRFDYVGTIPEDLAAFEKARNIIERVKHLFHLVHTDTGGYITPRMLRAVDRAAEALPSDASIDQFMELANLFHREEGAKENVFWDDLTASDLYEIGVGWQLFPNVAMLATADGLMMYRGRPSEDDPDRCLVDVWSLERRSPDDNSKTVEEVYDSWESGPFPRLIRQDFENLPYVQKGMHSRGFEGSRPNPLSEGTVRNMHEKIMSTLGLS